MRRLLVVLWVAGFVASLGYPASASEMKISSSLEVFYENSNDVGGAGDDDQFETRKLYVTLDGKFDEGLGARLKLDGADIENSDGDPVTHKIVEEANFIFNDIGGSPVTFVFGKDEMPYGLDYDKYLIDPIAHRFEIDKVWGVHGIVRINRFGNFAAAAYERRDSSAGNELTDNATARLMIDEWIENLIFEISFAMEEYTGSALDDEVRYNAGLLYEFIDGAKVNLEYNGFNNREGEEDYDPALATAGLEYGWDRYKVFGRYERVVEDASEDVEEDFYMIGASFIPAKRYTLSLEYANFNSTNLKDATDLTVADGALENTIIFGVKAAF